jgi:hypothetical protein
MNSNDVNNFIDGVLSGIELTDSETVPTELVIKQLKKLQEMVKQIEVNEITVPKTYPPVPSTPIPMWPGDNQFDPMYDPNRIIC